MHGSCCYLFLSRYVARPATATYDQNSHYCGDGGMSGNTKSGKGHIHTYHGKHHFNFHGVDAGTSVFCQSPPKIMGDGFRVSFLCPSCQF